MNAPAVNPDIRDGSPPRLDARGARASVRPALHRSRLPRADPCIGCISMPNAVQISTLLSIKTGGCPEDCAYCPQSAHYETGVDASKLMDVDAVRGRRESRACARRHALLHGRGLALAQGPRSRCGVQHGRGREGARHGNLRHARHADGRAGRAPERGGPRLLQPQSRHLAGILRRDHHARGPIRTASTRWTKCATPASMSAAAASSAWARAARTASA